MRTLIESSLRGNIVYKEQIEAGIDRVKIDLAELELAIVNIAVNARDAMPNGGVFSLTVCNVKADGGLNKDQSENFVALEFSDTGMGIPPSLLTRIFDPFFTTKEVGKGTGLGLSQVYGFAHQAGGTVQADSTVGQGTTITIYLPASTEAETVESAVADDEAARERHPVVLVVDDSAEVAEVTSSLFEHLGYDTVYRESADEALQTVVGRRQRRSCVQRHCHARHHRRRRPRQRSAVALSGPAGDADDRLQRRRLSGAFGIANPAQAVRHRCAAQLHR